MARVLSFSVKGLAGRDIEHSHTLNRYVNVFWGLNGTGKTSLLRILDSALSADAMSLRSVPFESAEVEILWENANRRIIRTLRKQDIEREGPFVVDVDEDGDPVYAYDSGAKWRTRVVGGRKGLELDPDDGLFHSYLPITRIANTSTRSRVGGRRPGMGSTAAYGDELFEEMFSAQIRDRWRTYNTRSLDSIRAIQQQGLAAILQLLFVGPNEKSDTVFSSDENQAYGMVTSFLRRQNLRLNVDRQSFASRYRESLEVQAIVARIEGVTEEIDSALGPQRKFQELISQFYSGDKTLEVGPTGLFIRTGETRLQPKALSSGERQLLQILLEVLSCDKSSILIDEPELSMHVDWQQNLIESMRTVNPESQLIVATHSPDVMANVPDSQVFELL